MMPVIFVGHGAPTLPLAEDGAVDFLRQLGPRLPKPRAVLVVSAHWETVVPTVASTAQPQTIHDFHGFPRELYEMTYAAAGAPEMACHTYHLLREHFPAVARDAHYGLDHGAWVPLKLIYPAADIPVFQVSIQPAEGPSGAYALGAALAPLRKEGVLILASGSLVHNLSEFRSGSRETPSWASEFDDWLAARLANGDTEQLKQYRREAPHAVKAHPRDEHLLPLFVAHGAAEGEAVTALYRGFMHGGLSMASYAFGPM